MPRLLGALNRLGEWHQSLIRITVNVTRRVFQTNTIEFVFYLSESCSVRTTKHVTLKYGCSSSTAQEIVRHSRYVLLYRLSAQVSEQDQYQIGFVVWSRCFSNSTHPTWTWQASVLSVIYPPAYGKVNVDEKIIFCWRLFITSSSFLFTASPLVVYRLTQTQFLNHLVQTVCRR